MTRMRFCTPEGIMEFKTKGELVKAPAGHLPWFEVPDRKSADKVVVAGHWSALGLKITPHLLALDSGCLWGGKLSALRLEDRQLFQVDCSPGEAQHPAPREVPPAVDQYMGDCRPAKPIPGKNAIIVPDRREGDQTPKRQG